MILGAGHFDESMLYSLHSFTLYGEDMLKRELMDFVLEVRWVTLCLDRAPTEADLRECRLDERYDIGMLLAVLTEEIILVKNGDKISVPSLFPEGEPEEFHAEWDSMFEEESAARAAA